MTPFRYSHFCPLSRATELLGERWTLLVVRELLMSPQRFSDLQRRLGAVSTSVLTERLERLEAIGLVQRRALPPPAASQVYELTEAGAALRPALTELARWGMRFLLPPRPGDRIEPQWACLALHMFSRRDATPELSFCIRVHGDGPDAVATVRGGADGTRVLDEAAPADVTLHVKPLDLYAVMTGLADVGPLLESGAIRAEGDAALLSRLPELFEVDFGRGAEETASAPE